MATLIYIEPDEAWEYIKENRKELEETPACFAEDTLYDVSIEVSIESSVGGSPWVFVTIEGELTESLEIEEDDAEDLFKEIYRIYLEEDSSEKTSVYKWTPEDDIHDRNDELNIAVEDFFITIWGTGCLYRDEDIEDFKERALKYLAEKYPTRRIYRPMILIDEKGEEVFEEYPYEEWEF